MKMKKYLIALAAILVSGILNCRADHITVTLQQAGALEKTVGNDILSTDSLTVRGPVNLADTKFIAKGAKEGKLVYLDMSGAQVENGILPRGLFCM